jgi:hypothetical protein
VGAAVRAATSGAQAPDSAAEIGESGCGFAIGSRGAGSGSFTSFQPKSGFTAGRASVARKADAIRAVTAGAVLPGTLSAGAFTGAEIMGETVVCGAGRGGSRGLTGVATRATGAEISGLAGWSDLEKPFVEKA